MSEVNNSDSGVVAENGMFVNFAMNLAMSISVVPVDIDKLY